MQINPINNLTNFGATIRQDENCEKFKKVLESRKLVPVSYDEFSESINKILPGKTDTVTFKKVEKLVDYKEVFDIQLRIKNNNKNFYIGIINHKDRVIDDILSMIKLCQQNGGMEERVVKVGRTIAVTK